MVLVFEAKLAGQEEDEDEEEKEEEKEEGHVNVSICSILRSIQVQQHLLFVPFES